jgi:hypothetical protein
MLDPDRPVRHAIADRGASFDTLRTKRRQRAEEAAAKTAIKMMFPWCSSSSRRCSWSFWAGRHSGDSRRWAKVVRYGGASSSGPSRPGDRSSRGDAADPAGGQRPPRTASLGRDRLDRGCEGLLLVPCRAVHMMGMRVDALRRGACIDAEAAASSPSVEELRPGRAIAPPPGTRTGPRWKLPAGALTAGRAAAPGALAGLGGKLHDSTPHRSSQGAGRPAEGSPVPPARSPKRTVAA